MVGQRLAALSSATHDALRAAAVIGVDFELDVLAATLRRQDDDVVSVADEALTAGLVHELSGHIDRFGFVHALVHEVVLSELSQSRRARLEWSVGEAVLALRGAEPASDVARHLAAGAAAGDAGKAADWCVRAASEASARLAYEEEVRYYETAQGVLALRAPGADRERADVLIALGRAANRGGDGERWRTACLEAADLARRSRDAVAVGGRRHQLPRLSGAGPDRRLRPRSDGGSVRRVANVSDDRAGTAAAG